MRHSNITSNEINPFHALKQNQNSIFKFNISSFLKKFLTISSDPVLMLVAINSPQLQNNFSTSPKSTLPVVGIFNWISLKTERHDRLKKWGWLLYNHFIIARLGYNVASWGKKNSYSIGKTFWAKQNVKNVKIRRQFEERQTLTDTIKSHKQ